ncbi:MAG: recQ 2, partial [Caproiciproducens sp.]|nr:recQ 2 [Caproiciproducens sp.]
MNDKYQILKQYFGYSDFRDGQETLIDAILKNSDAVGIMPTGAGKSLCFQVPALLMDGITLVISPLISLMKDQVNALTQAGVRAAYLNSSLSAGQYRRALSNACNGMYRIIYVAPERLMTDDFQNFVQQSTISMVTVDEAHCVSQWGQDFRPSYLQIPQFIETLPNRPILSAFTATATVEVRDDIIRMLKLQDPVVVSTGFNRENLYFEVQHPKDKTAALLHILENYTDKSGIVYCLTRKNVEEVCTALCEKGYQATRYHAGLPDEERKKNQEDFLYDQRTVMVATNAFGMGIDKSNVSFVIHYNMPKNIESYYQEAGRGGRDGEPAQCILLYSGQDVITNLYFIGHANENDALDDKTRELVQKKDRERLKSMTNYCQTNECLRTYILNYFGEYSASFCGNCYNCNHNFEKIDITTEAQKILSCVKRLGERYGVKMVVDTLRGCKTEKILRLRFNEQQSYGMMADVKEQRIREMINFLVINGYLSITNDEYPVVQ